jgi:hypothetical protein
MKNRKVVIQIAFSVGVCGALFLFTNATRMDSLMVDLVEESNKIESQLEQGVYQSEAAKGIIIAHQNRIGNLIALRMNAKSCAELQRVEKNLKSGIYTLYSRKKGTPFYCHVAQDGSVEHEIAVEQQPKQKPQENLRSPSGFQSSSPSKLPGLLQPATPAKAVTPIESALQKLFGRHK